MSRNLFSRAHKAFASTLLETGDYRKASRAEAAVWRKGKGRRKVVFVSGGKVSPR